MRLARHLVPNGDGWLLHLEQVWSGSALRVDAEPVAIIPGYGMNGFIFGFHPRGTTLRRALAEAGFEVWTLNLRGQGPSRRTGTTEPGRPSLEGYAGIDVSACVEAIRQRTKTETGRVNLLGCSLGGTIAYAHLALTPEHHVARVACVGSPLRWESVHPALRLALSSPALLERIKVRGARQIARLALPLISRTPALLAPYMNAANVDIAAAGELVRTVEDPDPMLNAQIARWIRAKDLILHGTNVTEAMRDVEIPLLLVLANRDGIVPTGAADSARTVWGGQVEVLNVGDEEQWYSHADLFVGNDAPRHVFAPLADWFYAA